jgi:hypothetical protein
MINENAQISFNKRAIELVEKLIKKKLETTYSQKGEGSDAEIYAMDWSDKFDHSQPTVSRSMNGLTMECSDIFLTNKEHEIGFEGESYTQFIKLSKSVHKAPEIYKRVNHSFVETELFKWIVKVEEAAKIEKDFCAYLEDKITDISDTWTVAFKVLYLRITCKIQIGDTWLDYTRKDEIEDHIIQKGETDEKQIQESRNLYGNTVYVACKIENCSRERAIELALDKCSLSIDILKTFSPTIEFPNVPLQFDIDSRTTKNAKNFTYVFKETFFDNLTINLAPSAGQPLVFHQDFVEHLHSHIFQKLDNYDSKTNELRDVVKMNVKRFSIALSNQNLYERIVQIASIWDSIFLSNENEPVLFTISRYGPKIVSISVSDRKKVKKLIKTMYGFRSAYIHRAVQSKMEMKDLADFQIYTKILLSALTHLSFSYSSTTEILKIIDDDLESAFNITSHLRDIPIMV